MISGLERSTLSRVLVHDAPVGACRGLAAWTTASSSRTRPDCARSAAAAPVKAPRPTRLKRPYTAQA
jgi:hypothetical protein